MSLHRTKGSSALAGIAVWMFCLGLCHSAWAQEPGSNVQRATKLGLTVSRPTLTYAQVGNEVWAVVVVGCGDDPNAERAKTANSDAPGRCVLVLKADDGSLVRRFETGNGLSGDVAMDYPMLGSPSVYPAIGTTPARRAYMGDGIGRLWRIDMRSTNPNQWSMDVAWPTQEAVDEGRYPLGRGIEGRPSIILRSSGRLGVIFGTSISRSETPVLSTIVHFTDRVVLDENDELSYSAEQVWVMPLRLDEVLKGEVQTRSGGVYFTTSAVNSDGEGPSIGRLYGVHATRISERYATIDGRTLNVSPALPDLTTDSGQRVTDAMAIRLPPGKVSHGLTIFTSPSCVEDEEPTTEVILNLTRSVDRPGAPVGETRIERKRGELVPGRLDEDFVAEGLSDVAIKIKPPPIGVGVETPGFNQPPFSRRALYWGSTYSQ